MRHKTLDERMNEGGPLFYAVAIIGALGFMGFLWLTMALGIALGL
jgi:hypothetical protein